MAFNTQEQEIIKYGVQNGKSKQEVETAISNFRSGVVPKPKVEQAQATSFTDGLSRVASTYSKNLKEQAVGGVENAQKTFGMGVDTMQNSKLGMQPNSTEQQKNDAVAQYGAGVAQIGIGAASGLVQTAFSPLTALIQTGVQGLAELDQATGGKIQNQLATLAQSHPELIKGYSDMVRQNPKSAQFVSDSINVLTAGIGGKPALEAVQGTTKGLVTGAKEALASTPKSIDGIPVATMADEALHSGLQLKNDIQLSIAKKNVSPQLESSAGRLMSDTAQNVENPVVAYDKYLSQSKKSLGDIKVDAPISTVGGKIGDAFMKVVKQKQEVGTTLGDELKTVGKLKVSVVEPKGTLLSELKDSGLSYNPRTNELTSFQGSKFAPEEVSMLNQYVKDVQKLGDTPSVSQIDNFIAKTRSDLNFAKGKSGVTGTTNAERIIKGNLAGMRESLNPSKNGLTQLSKYWNANKAYSELSDFVDEGAGFLGKTTQSGDFAKDASVAKSSVQSILNGGKKDWLIKLEGLTGYPALDESVLALQAMKDAGDFKGLSLLQAMQESGGIPTSKAGFTQKILDMAVATGEKLIVGTPEEQTRALLQDLSNKAKMNNTLSTPTIAKPTGGQSTQSIKSSNSSDIYPQSTPTSQKGKGIRGMYNIDEIINSFKKDPVYKNFTQDIVGTSKVEKGNLLNVKDSGRYAWRAGRDASLLVDNVDLPDNAFRSIVGKSREDVISSLEENINKFNSEKGSVPPTDVKKINEVMDYVDRVKSELVPKKKVAPTLEQEAKNFKSAEEFVNSIKKLSNDEKIKITKDLENLHNQKIEDFSKNSVVSDLFHATPHDFSEFKLTQGERAGVLGGNKKVDNLAIFTTDNKELAQHFGKNRAEGTPYKMLELKANIQKPLDIRSGVIPDAELNKLGLKILQEWDGIKRSKIPNNLQYFLVDSNKFVDAAKNKGFDAIHLREVGKPNETTYAVFNPSNLLIKKQFNPIKELTDIWNKSNNK